MLFLMALRTCSFHVFYQKFASLMLVFLCVGAYVCSLLPHESFASKRFGAWQQIFSFVCIWTRGSDQFFASLQELKEFSLLADDQTQSHWVKNSLKRFTLF
jgi:hypothetical protein